MIDPHMAVHIKISGFLRVLFHPGAGEFAHPLSRGAVGSHERDFSAQGAHLRHPVETNHLAQFAGRKMPESFGPADASQRHEPQNS